MTDRDRKKLSLAQENLRQGMEALELARMHFGRARRKVPTSQYTLQDQFDRMVDALYHVEDEIEGITYELEETLG